MRNNEAEYERLLTLYDALFTQEINILLAGIKQKCSELYTVRRRLCNGASIGELKTVLAKNPNKRLGNTYRLLYFRHASTDHRKGAFLERWPKGKNGLPDRRYLLRFVKDTERDVVIEVLKDLALLDQRLQKVQDALWELRSERVLVLDAFTTTPTQRAAEMGNEVSSHGQI